MDISTITDFIDMFDVKHISTNMLLCYRNTNWLKEYKDRIRLKNRDFNDCIMRLCMTHGINAAQLLVVYREQLQEQLKWYRFKKETLDSKIFAKDVNSKSHSQMLSPFLNNLKDVSLTTEYKYNEYNVFRNYLRFMISTLLDTIKSIDKILITFGVQPQAAEDISIMKKQGNSSNGKDDTSESHKPPHYNNLYTENQLKYILNVFKVNGYIDNDTSDADFIYFFSGKGKPEVTGLKWTAQQNRLTIFLKTFFGNDECIWKKAESIFNVSNLSKVYNRESVKSIGEKYESYFKNLKKTVESI